MSIRNCTVALLLCAGAALAQSSEVEDLKRRVADLEAQNRQILQALAELRASLKPQSAAVPATATAAVSAPSAPRPEIVSTGNAIKFYGWLRADADIDSQRPNSGVSPLFITSGTDKGLLTFHPRLTRFGLDLNGPTIDSLGGARISGKLETDFENGGSESREIIRIRHAYFQLKWSSGLTLLGGQTWDVFSPLFPTVNNDTLMWNAGNVGDRRPQFRVDQQIKSGRGTWSLTGAAGLTGAIDAADLDANGYLDGQESGRPNLQGRIGYSRPVFDQQFSLGASMFYGWINTQRPLGGRTVFHSQAQNIDLTLPLARGIALRGEGWWGRNMSDIRGGAGQGFNAALGREIRGRGGWGEATFKLSRYWTIAPGYTTDDPVDADVANGGRTRNGAFYIGNRITPGGSFQIGADYLRWVTIYKGPLPGIDHRVNLFFIYAF